MIYAVVLPLPRRGPCWRLLAGCCPALRLCPSLSVIAPPPPACLLRCAGAAVVLSSGLGWVGPSRRSVSSCSFFFLSVPATGSGASGRRHFPRGHPPVAAVLREGWGGSAGWFARPPEDGPCLPTPTPEGREVTGPPPKRGPRRLLDPRLSGAPWGPNSPPGRSFKHGRGPSKSRNRPCICALRKEAHT